MYKILKHSSIKVKLIAAILFAALFFLFGDLIVNCLLLRGKIYKEMQIKMSHLAEHLHQEEKQLLEIDSKVKLQNLLKGYLGFYGVVRIDMVSGSGELEFSTADNGHFNSIESIYPGIGRKLLEKAKANRIDPAIYLNESDQVEIMILATRSPADHFLIFKADSAKIYSENIWDFVKVSMRVICFLSLASWFVWSFINRQIIKRLRKISEGVLRLSNEEYETDISVDGNDEIDELGRLLNQVARQLKITSQDLKKFYFAIEQTGDLVMMTDKNGIIEYVNPALTQTMKYEKSELIGKSPRVLKSGEQGLDIYQDLWKTINSGNVWVKRIVNKAKDGSRVPILTSISPIFDNQKKISNFIAIQKDSSKDIEIENKLSAAVEAAQSADRAKSLFLASMSHEIRTPMNIILGMAQLLSETELNEEQTKFVNTLKQSGSGLLNIINDILDFSKIEAGQMSFEATEFSLKKISQQCVLAFQSMAQEKGLKINLNYEADLPEYYIGDPVRINQVLTNLVHNAIKFTDRGGVDVSITKNISLKPGNLLIEVRDTGLGIEPSFHKDIFKLFSQAGTFAQRNFGGTGLGLAISKKIVGNFKGSIWFESCLDIGTSFFFTLDIKETKETKKVNILQVNNLEQFTNKPLKILLAEDLSENVMVIKALFKKTKWFFDDCCNGEIAINKFASEKYDLVLMDIEMPVIDGFEATKRMRMIEKQENREPTPILGLSAHALKEFKDQMQEAGCDNYIVKPLSRDNLTETIIRYCFNTKNSRNI